MKKLLSALCVFALLLSITGCVEKNSEPTILRSFLAGYEENVDENGVAERSSRVLLNLMSDGTAEFYVGVLDQGTHTTARYSGTYSMGENVTFTYDIRTTEGEVVSAGEIAEGTGYNGVNLSTAFNIEQATMRASAAQFIRVTEKGE